MATKEERAAFITKAGPAARKSEQTTGVSGAVTVAQAILESGWGEHHMGPANNYFGIKAQERNGKIDFGSVATGYVDKLTKEYKPNGTPYTIVDHFRSYKSMADSFIDHGIFLQGTRYQKALVAYASNKDADAYARAIGKAGYATDPKYADTLIGLMKKYNLYQFSA